MRVAFLAFAVLLAIGDGLLAPRPSPQAAAATSAIRTIKGFEQFQQWARAVRDHAPGEWDEPARSVAAWSLDDLRLLQTDLVNLRRLLQAAGRQALVQYPEPGRGGARPTGRMRQMFLTSVPAMLLIADDDPGLRMRGTSLQLAVSKLDGQVTTVMRVAAMLHADIAILAPPGPATTASIGPDAGVVRISDGRAIGRDDAPVHWQLGCMALDLVKPDPARDAFVVDWYRASAAWQGHRRSYGYERPHLEYGRRILPADAWLQFYTGVMLENLAAPPVQAAVSSLPGGAVRYRIESDRLLLEDAEAYYGRALAGQPDLTIAALRLGRVKGLLGRHADAAAMLEALLPALATKEARYFGELFLGAEAQSLGRLDDARAAFVRARALFPRAQSPHLALSQIAWVQADRAAAIAAFRALAALPATGAERWDPWWTYDVFPVADAPDRIGALRTEALVFKVKHPGGGR